MSSKPTQKYIIFGDVLGQFEKLSIQLRKYHTSKAGPFTAAFCVGQFFAGDDAAPASVSLSPFQQGKLQFDIPVYFILGNEAKSQTQVLLDAVAAGTSAAGRRPHDVLTKGGEIAPNLIYLGRSGVKTDLIEGLTVAYLSGTFDEHTYTSSSLDGAAEGEDDSLELTSGAADKFRTAITQSMGGYASYYTQGDVQKVIDESKQAPRGMIDILLTAEWGKGWHNLLADSALPTAMRDPLNVGSPAVALLASTLSIRYHFAGSERSYLMLPPYRGAGNCVCQFYGMGAFGAEESQPQGQNQKAVVAISYTALSRLTPEEILIMQGSSNATACPYLTPRPPRQPFGEVNEAQQGSKRVKMEGGTGASYYEDEASRQARFLALEREEEALANRPGVVNGVERWNLRPPPGYVCKICNSSEHFIRNCPNRHKPPSDYVCQACKAQGEHWVKHCPNRSEGQPSSGKPPAEYVCVVCNAQAEHYVRECPARAERDAKRAAEREARKAASSKPPEGYVCKICQAENDHYIRECPKRQTETAKPVATDADCWFCLSNTDKVETHLISSIGDNVYIALPRGPLHPQHIMILPVSHTPYTSALPEEARAEMANWKQALIRCFGSKNMGVVFYERHMPTKSTQHMQIHAIPVTASQRKSVKAAIENAFEAKGLALEVLQPSAGETKSSEDVLIQAVGESPSPYVYFEVPAMGELPPIHLLFRVPLVPNPKAGGAPMPLRIPGLFEIPRAALANLLGCPDRIDWKTCVDTKEDEAKLTQEFRTLFTPFDPSADESDLSDTD